MADVCICDVYCREDDYNTIRVISSINNETQPRRWNCKVVSFTTFPQVVHNSSFLQPTWTIRNSCTPNYHNHHNLLHNTIYLDSKTLRWLSYSHQISPNPTYYKILCYRLEYNHFQKRTTQYNIKYVCDSIIKDLGLQLKELD